jgi:hypothetical protein
MNSFSASGDLESEEYRAGRRQWAQPGQVERHPHRFALLGHAGGAALLAKVAGDAHDRLARWPDSWLRNASTRVW